MGVVGANLPAASWPAWAVACVPARLLYRLMPIASALYHLAGNPPAPSDWRREARPEPCSPRPLCRPTAACGHRRRTARFQGLLTVAGGAG